MCYIARSDAGTAVARPYKNKRGLSLFIIPRSMTYKESTIEKDYKRAHIAESGKICRAEDAEMTNATRDVRN